MAIDRTRYYPLASLGESGVFLDRVEMEIVFFQNSSEIFRLSGSKSIEATNKSFTGTPTFDNAQTAFQINDGDVVQSSPSESQWEFRATGAGLTNNPVAFRLGRIVEGPLGPKFRFLYVDTPSGADYSGPEIAAGEFEGTGTWASIRQGGATEAASEGSFFEGFLGTNAPTSRTYPSFRLNSFPSMQLEFGQTAESPDAETDITLRRTDATTLRVFNKETGAQGRLNLGTLINGSGSLEIQKALHFTPPANNTPGGGTAVTIDWEASNYQLLDLEDSSGDVAVTLNNPHASAAYRLLVYQGSTARQLTWPANVKWAGGSAPTLTATENNADLFELFYMDGNYWSSHLAANLS